MKFATAMRCDPVPGGFGKCVEVSVIELADIGELGAKSKGTQRDGEVFRTSVSTDEPSGGINVQP